MKTLLLLALALFFMACTPVLAKGTTNYRSIKCETEYMAAAMIARNIEVTVQPGDRLTTHVGTFLNHTAGEQYVVMEIWPLDELELPAKWLRFKPAAFCVEAGGNQLVDVSIRIPKKATQGTYSAILVFQVQGGRVGAAVGIKAWVTVE